MYHTPWKKSKNFGDIYGGRKQLRLDDNIFRRAHSLQRPSTNQELPILLQDNPSRDFFFPISAEEAKHAIKALPKDDYQGITHIWLRRLNKVDFEKGDLPLAEFICGSGVRVIILYPFPINMLMQFGSKKPSVRKLKEVAKWCNDLQYIKGNWVLKWQPDALRQYYISHLLYHEVGHHIDWYNRHWSAANTKQLESFADQYAIQKTVTAVQVFDGLKNI